MFNVSKCSDTFLKKCAAFTARSLSKCIGPFPDIMHYRVILVRGHPLNAYPKYS